MKEFRFVNTIVLLEWIKSINFMIGYSSERLIDEFHQICGAKDLYAFSCIQISFIRKTVWKVSFNL